MGNRILYIAPTFLPTLGGAELFLDRLVRHISDHYDEVYLIVPHCAQDIKRDNVHVYRTKRIPLPVLAESSYFLCSTGLLLYFLTAKQIKIVHFNLPSATAFCGVFLCKLFKAKTVFTFHGTDFRLLRTKSFLSKLKEFAMRRCSAITVVSQFMFDDLKQKFKENLYLIPNGVDTRLFTPPSRPERVTDTTNLLFVGNIRREKGVDILIEALALVKESEPTLKINLKVVGKDSQNVVSKLSGEFGISEYIVEELGAVPSDQLPEIYQKADIFVMPSRFEGLSLALLEAMASGLPIIATDIPGVKTVLTHNENAVLTEPENPESMANAIETLVKNPDFANLLGKNARLTAEQCDWKELFEKYEKLYSTL